jgi:CDP-diacylglycerol--serine O-phosphatidyltransferase
MPLGRLLRYLAPNAVTAASIVFSVLAVQAALRGEIIWGAWWALYSTLTDKLDGAVARLLKASSPIGVQLDSLADLLNYGMAPATLTYAFFLRERSLGWSEGPKYVLLCTICVLYVLCAALRLARFNVSSSNSKMFFGIPSTMSGACTMSLFVFLGKYGDPAWTAGESYPGPRPLEGVDLSAIMPAFPIVLMGFGLAMISRWRVPKLGGLRTRAGNLYVGVNLVLGYTFGLLHILPEFLVFGGVQYVLVALYSHFFTTPKVLPEPIFPVEDQGAA